MVSECMEEGGRDSSMNFMAVCAAQDAGKVQNYPPSPQFCSSIFHASYAEHILSVLLLFCVGGGKKHKSCPFLGGLHLLPSLSTSFHPLDLCVSLVLGAKITVLKPPYRCGSLQECKSCPVSMWFWNWSASPPPPFSALWAFGAFEVNWCYSSFHLICPVVKLIYLFYLIRSPGTESFALIY